MTTGADIQQWITQVLPSADVQIESADGRHFEVTVVDEIFEDKTMLEQHRIVHQALGDKMRTQIHGLTIHTLTPEQAARPDDEE